MAKTYQVVARWREYVGTGQSVPAGNAFEAILAVGFILLNVEFEAEEVILILAPTPESRGTNPQRGFSNSARIPVIKGSVCIPEGKVWGTATSGIGNWESAYLGCMEKLGLLRSCVREKWGWYESPAGRC